jgi:predicted peptidase
MTDKMVALAYADGSLYAENVHDDWISWKNGAWIPALGPTLACETAAVASAGSSSSRLTIKPLGTTSAPNGYYEYLPPQYDGKTLLPLLVFLHGVGENGDGSAQDLPILLDHGPGLVISNDAWPASRPFVVLEPQHDPAGVNLSGTDCPAHAEINAFLQWAIVNYRIDTRNVFLTGLSCGAIGSWDYFGTYTDTLVSAAVLMSGEDLSGAWQGQGCNLASVAFWNFHGTADTTVPFAPDQTLALELQACPLPPRQDIEFTPVENGGHIIWDPIYDLSGGYGDIYAWLLANHAR